MTTASGGYYGVFNSVGGSMRNLTVGLNVSVTIPNSTTSYIGSLAGYSSGTLANITATGGAINVTTTAPAPGSAPLVYEGGLVGMTVGRIINSTATNAVTFTYAGTATGTGQIFAGGLVGYDSSGNAAPITGSTAGGSVNLSESQTGCSGPCTAWYGTAYEGGLAGRSGNTGGKTVSGNVASGSVTDTLFSQVRRCRRPDRVQHEHPDGREFIERERERHGRRTGPGNILCRRPDRRAGYERNRKWRGRPAAP